MAEGERRTRTATGLCIFITIIIIFLLRHVVLKIRFHEIIYNYPIGFRLLLCLSSSCSCRNTIFYFIQANVDRLRTAVMADLNGGRD